jgi:hypothetical protein
LASRVARVLTGIAHLAGDFTGAHPGRYRAADHRGMAKRTRRAYLSLGWATGWDRHIAARIQAEPLGGVSTASIQWFPCGIRAVARGGYRIHHVGDGRIGSMDPRRYDQLPTLHPFATGNGKPRNPKTRNPKTWNSWNPISILVFSTQCTCRCDRVAPSSLASLAIPYGFA